MKSIHHIACKLDNGATLIAYHPSVSWYTEDEIVIDLIRPPFRKICLYREPFYDYFCQTTVSIIKKIESLPARTEKELTDQLTTHSYEDNGNAFFHDYLVFENQKHVTFLSRNFNPDLNQFRLYIGDIHALRKTVKYHHIIAVDVVASKFNEWIKEIQCSFEAFI